MSQKQTRNKIELLKEEVRSSFENDTLAYKRAVIRELDSLWRSYKNKNHSGGIEKFADDVFNFLKVPQSYRNTIVNELKETQTQIAGVWDEYFHDSVKPGTTLRVDYEKMLAAYSVDFPSIDKDIRDTVVKELRQSAKSNYSFETIRTNLQKSTMGTSQINTLANTAVAQFDNASMFEFALQSGVTKFIYDGVLHPGTRLFCVMHIKHAYTYEQILTMDNGQGLEVKTSCGGYNCIHYWSPDLSSIKTVKEEKKTSTKKTTVNIPKDVKEKTGVEYKPTMTKKEAAIWNKDSVVKNSFYHGTASTNVQSISENGFRLDKTTTGRVYGNGVYLAKKRDIAEKFAKINQKETDVLELKVNVKNPFYLEDLTDFKYNVLMAKGYKLDAEGITKYLTDNGYDALITKEVFKDAPKGADIIVVLDPKNIVRVKDE